MTDFVYNPDNSQVLVPRHVNIKSTSVFLQNEVDALIDWIEAATLSAPKEKQELKKKIKEHFSNARALSEDSNSRAQKGKLIKKLINYASMPKSKAPEGVGRLKKFIDVHNWIFEKKARYSMNKISYFGFPDESALRTVMHLDASKVDDNTKTTQDVLSIAKKQKNFVSSAKEVSDALKLFVAQNKLNLHKATIKYDINFIPDGEYAHQTKSCKIDVEIGDIISSLTAFNKSILGLINSQCTSLLGVDLDKYQSKKWTGSLDNSDIFRAKEAFYLMATDGKTEGFIGMKETNHSGGGLWRQCIVKDINSAYIFHTMPRVHYEFTNVHKINVAIDFKDVVKTPKAKDMNIATRIQSYIEKNKLEDAMNAATPSNANLNSNEDKKKLKQKI